MEKKTGTIFDSPVCDLSRHFGCAKVARVMLPDWLHNQYVILYQRAAEMHRQIDRVMQDEEHHMVLDQYRYDPKLRERYNLNLPDEDFLYPEMAGLERSLNGLDAFSFRKHRDGRTSISMEEAQGYFDVYSASHKVVHRVVDMLQKSDYLKMMSLLRRVDFTPYTGPVALGEILNMHFRLAHMDQVQRGYFGDLLAERDERLEAKVIASLATSPIIKPSQP